LADPDIRRWLGSLFSDDSASCFLWIIFIFFCKHLMMSVVFCVLCMIGKIKRSQCSLQADVDSYVVATDRQVWIRSHESRWFINQTSESSLSLYFYRFDIYNLLNVIVKFCFVCLTVHLFTFVIFRTNMLQIFVTG